MSGNWSLKIRVVNFTDNVGMALEFFHQQMGISEHTQPSAASSSPHPRRGRN